MQYLNPKFLLNANNYKSNYFCWILLGDLYNGEELTKELVFNKNSINSENIAAYTAVEKGENLISFYSKDYSFNIEQIDVDYYSDENTIDDNCLIFKRIKENDTKNTITIDSPNYIYGKIIALVNLGTTKPTNILTCNKEIIYYNTFVYTGEINKSNYKGFDVGKIKVNLNGLIEE